MTHYAPHRHAAFEGYYSRFTLPDDSSVCLIVSAVQAAAREAKSVEERRSKRPFYIVLTYTSSDSSKIVQKEYWPDTFDLDIQPDKSFTIAWEEGYLKWDRKTDVVAWKLDTPSTKFIASTKGDRIAWKQNDDKSTPAGFIAELPSPIQWHVHSLSSQCDYKLEIPEDKVFEEGEGKVHYEKNWAMSFPDSYIWLQARDHEGRNGICLAGGSLIPGVEAFLVGYQGSKPSTRFISYIPWVIFGFSLTGLSTSLSWLDRRFEVDIKGWFTRLRVNASAPKETFFNFAAPLRTGHQPNYCTQSYQTTVEVEVWKRDWPWSGWKVVERTVYERGGMEFGGGAMKHHDD